MPHFGQAIQLRGLDHDDRRYPESAFDCDTAKNSGQPNLSRFRSKVNRQTNIRWDAGRLELVHRLLNMIDICMS